MESALRDACNEMNLHPEEYFILKNMIFEVMDLAVASPAIVSRCGMVYLESHQLGWRPLTVSWLNTLPEHIPEKAKEHLLGLFDWLVPVSLRFVRREIKKAAPAMDSNLIVTLMRIITSLTHDWKDAKVFSSMDDATVRHHFESIFVFSLVWSIGYTGATLNARNDFDKFFRTAMASQLETFSGPSGERYNLPEDIPKNHVTMEPPMIPNAFCSVLLCRSNAFRKMEDCRFVCGMGPPGGGRNPVTQRYSRHFNMVSLVDFDNGTPTQIFTSIVDMFRKKEAFPDNVKELSSPIVAATLEVYFTAMNQLLPTPAKSHYTFNLRDISRVGNGLLMMKPETLGKGGAVKDLYLRLWNHEILRVFYDRLVDERDQQWFLSALQQTTATSLDADFDKLLKHVADEANIVDTESIRKCFFGDCMQEAEEPSLRPYSEVIDIAPFISKMEDFLVDRNSTSKQAMFLYAVKHVSRVCRVLKQPGAHMLCVGLGGGGRKSLSRFGAYICGMKTFQIEISKNYTTVEWREDLKKMTRRAGGGGQACVFLFSDMQIKEVSFVEDINCHLNTGEFPSFVNCCTIDWAKPVGGGNLTGREQMWVAPSPEKDPKAIAMQREGYGASRKEIIVDQCGGVIVMSGNHPGVARLIQYWMKNTIQPLHPGELQTRMTSNFFKALSYLLDNSPAVETTTVGVIHNVLSHLASVQTKEDFVCGLARGFSGAKMAMDIQQQFINQLTRWTGVDQIARSDCALSRPRGSMVTGATDNKKTDLAEAVNQVDIKYLKKLRRPPEGVQMVMEAVCVLLNGKPPRGTDDSWNTAIAWMHKKEFIMKIKSLDKNHVHPKTLKKIRSIYMSSEAFSPDNVKRACPEAEGLCKWVHAVSSAAKLFR
ncbi:hypothetical protein BSKO_10897 [Bryopsis sp. KO-2023]|nr:hypothetical protein BSKO_10897 [Bryopsis sp. KO-2023]